MDHFRPITADTLAQIKIDLSASLDEARAQVEMCGRIALALDPIAHHKQLNAGIATRIKKTIPEHYAHWHERYGRHVLYITWRITGQVYGDYRLEFDVPDDMTMPQLIETIRSAYGYGNQVYRLEAQIENLPLLVETEGRLRTLFGEIETIRKTTKQLLVGDSYAYYHNSVRVAFTALCGK